MKLFCPRFCGVAVTMVLFAANGFGQEPNTRTIHSQPSFVVSTSQVELAVTELGGHMAPVTFFRSSAKPVRPYHVSLWQDEKPSAMPAPVLNALRGDFFCMPFGGNSDSLAGEKHPPHGEIVGEKWKYVGTTKSADVTTLTMSIETRVRRGEVTKELSLVADQNVVYSKHIINGFTGNVPLGHHATLAMPDKEGSVRLASSAFRLGMTYPGIFSDPKQREYQSLLPGARWTTLAKVPVAWKGEPDADLTRLPARQGHADLVQVVNEPWEKTNGPAWMTATFTDAGYLWFSLKDANVLNSTVFWIENRGRHGHPWNGRNNCLGLEDVTSFFADGLKASTSDNILNKEGVATSVKLEDTKPTIVYYIQGVVKIPDGFEMVKSLEFAPGEVTFLSTTGKRVTTKVRHSFLRTGKL
ncbi:MAG: hypothetical protein NTZ71_12345 [Planctomycetota bacterium]|nr:hypothetical protein [Planctomycetota bacterium]